MLIIPYTVLKVFAVILFSLAAVLLIFVYIPMYFRYTEYTVYETEIRKTSGVFMRTTHSIKFTAVQYCTFAKLPFSSLIGSNFIIFYVYGGNMVLYFLKREDAEYILEKAGISGQGGESDVS